VKKILMFPSQNLVVAIPVVLVLGFILGLNVSLVTLKSLILPLTFLMIYPTMIGFDIKKVVDVKNSRIIGLSLSINFILIPIIAFLIASVFMHGHSELFVGLIMIALFPTSGMTISWTSLSKGNVTAAISIVAISLIIGAFVAPVYLAGLIGNIVEINVTKTFLTIFQIVLLPLIVGNITYRLLLTKMTEESFKKNVKPNLPAISVWAMLFIVFISIGMKAQNIATHPESIVNGLVGILLFYLVNYVIITIIARRFLKVADGYALLYGTVMRNLSVALGVAVASFSSDTVLLITIAYVVQIQSAAWYGMLSQKYNWLDAKVNSIIGNKIFE